MRFRMALLNWVRPERSIGFLTVTGWALCGPEWADAYGPGARLQFSPQDEGFYVLQRRWRWR